MSAALNVAKFAPNPSAPAAAPILAPVGSIQEVAKANHLDNETTTIGTVVFEYRVTAGSVTAGHIKVDISAATTAASVAAIFAPLIQAQSVLDLTASANGSGLISLSANLADDPGLTITTTVADVGYTTASTAVPTGTKTWTYKIVGVAVDGTHTAASATGSTAAGGSALSVANLNRLTWTDPLNATSILVYRTVDGASSTPSTLGLIATVAAGVGTLDDTGLAGDGSTAPTTNTTGVGTPLRVGSLQDLTVQVGGTFTATLQIQGVVGDTLAFANIGSTISSGGFTDITATVKSLSKIRVIMTAYTSGTPLVYIAGHQVSYMPMSTF